MQLDHKEQIGKTHLGQKHWSQSTFAEANKTCPLPPLKSIPDRLE